MEIYYHPELKTFTVEGPEDYRIVARDSWEWDYIVNHLLNAGVWGESIPVEETENDMLGIDVGTITGGIRDIKDIYSVIVDGEPSAGSGLQDVVPVQDRIHYEVLAPVSSALGNPNLSYDDLTMLLNVLTATENSWLNFLRNTPWATSQQRTRAAGAEKTLEPYFYSLKNEINARLSEYNWFERVASSPTITTIPPVASPIAGRAPVLPSVDSAYPVSTAGFSTSGMSVTTLAFIGVAAYFLLRKR